MNRKLLLADDSITIQKVIGITFANEDVTLSIADNGDSAFEMAQADHPDLVMADILMPGRNGYELCEAIKRDPQLSNVPVLLLSGTFEPFDEEKAKAAGADGWIAKPFESQALIEKVQRLLSLAPDQLARPKQAAGVAPQPPVAPVESPSIFSAPDPESEPAVAAAAQPDMWTEQPSMDESVFEAPAFDEPQELDAFVTPAQASLEETVTDAEASTWDEFSIDEQEVAGDGLPVQPLTPEMEPLSAQDDDEDILVLDEADIIEDEQPVQDELEEQQAPSAAAQFFAPPEAPAVVEPDSAFMAADSSPDFAPVEEPESFSADVSAPAPEPEQSWSAPEESVSSAVATQSPAPTAPSMSEEQMAAVVERVATEVVNRLAGTILEKIAWEVVPDLAESLIKDEIRKIKEALK